MTKHTWTLGLVAALLTAGTLAGTATADASETDAARTRTDADPVPQAIVVAYALDPGVTHGLKPKDPPLTGLARIAILPGGSDGGGGSTEPETEWLGTEEYAYGHWYGYGDWYKVTNDADSANRQYITTTRFLGRGFSSNQPGGDGYYHQFTDAYHLARGWGGDGNTFLRNFNPTTGSTGAGTYSFDVGWPPSAGYSWTQERPAALGFGLWDFQTHGWDDQEYGGVADFEAVGGDTTYRGWLENSAAGVVPTGSQGYMYLSMFHMSYVKQGCCTELAFMDDTGWKVRPITWT